MTVVLLFFVGFFCGRHGSALAFVGLSAFAPPVAVAAWLAQMPVTAVLSVILALNLGVLAGLWQRIQVYEA